MADRKEVLARLDLPSLLKELLPNAKTAGKHKLLAHCPWGERHKNNDAHPSFLAFPRDGNFKCLACGVKGSIFDLYGKIHHLDYRGAITALAKRVGFADVRGRANYSSYKVTGSYIYHDEAGEFLYWKERIEPGPSGKMKDFYFFHGKDVEPGTAFFRPADQKQTGRGCEPVLYHLPDVLNCSRVFFTEGEKQSDLLLTWGITSTTLDSGSSSPLTEDMVAQLWNKEIVILPDNDPPGRAYAERLATALHKAAARIKIVHLPDLSAGVVTFPPKTEPLQT